MGQALLVIVRIQTDFSRKASLSSVFLIRVVYVLNLGSSLRESANGTCSVIIAIICQLAYASQLPSSSDSTFDSWAVTVSTQVAQTLSIVTACSPQFKPFLDNLRSSGMGLGMTSSNYGSKHRTYAVSTFKNSRRMQGTQGSETHELVSMPHQGTETIVTSTREDDNESQSSQSRIIMETRTWTVTGGVQS
jgi:hypothetical protein